MSGMYVSLGGLGVEGGGEGVMAAIGKTRVKVINAPLLSVEDHKAIWDKAMRDEPVTLPPVAATSRIKPSHLASTSIRVKVHGRYHLTDEERTRLWNNESVMREPPRRDEKQDNTQPLRRDEISSHTT